MPQVATNSPFHSVIDWDRPWLRHVRPAAAKLLQAPEWRKKLNEAAAGMALVNHRGLPLSFVEQEELPVGTAYESFISAEGKIPTRENLHDFFNALVWLTFPKTKVRLNALQAAEICRSTKVEVPIQKGRGKIRDAATIFDENAVLLIARTEKQIDALREHRWKNFFLGEPDFHRNCEVWLFGHALMEKLVSPYKAITGHAFPVIADELFFQLPPENKRAWIDSTVSEHLSEELSTTSFMPLPILGVPGWCSGQDDVFYEDAQVFRPKKPASAARPTT